MEQTHSHALHSSHGSCLKYVRNTETNCQEKRVRVTEGDRDIEQEELYLSYKKWEGIKIEKHA